MTLNSLTIAEARDRLRARDISAAELTDACLSAVDGAGALNAFVHHTPEIARQQARTKAMWLDTLAHHA